MSLTTKVEPLPCASLVEKSSLPGSIAPSCPRHSPHSSLACGLASWHPINSTVTSCETTGSTVSLSVAYCNSFSWKKSIRTEKSDMNLSNSQNYNLISDNSACVYDRFVIKNLCKFGKHRTHFKRPNYQPILPVIIKKDLYIFSSLHSTLQNKEKLLHCNLLQED